MERRRFIKICGRRFLAIAVLVLFVSVGSRAQLVKGMMRDDEGYTINAHGAGILYYSGTYYLFGEIKGGKTWLVPHQQWEDYRVPAGGVSCYSSTDLKHWKYEGVALAPVVGDTTRDLDTSRVIERPKVVYNAKTKEFVMWMHVDKKDYSYSRAGVAISDNPAGPYLYVGSVRPNGHMARDITLFQDEDGKAYIIYASENNKTMHVCQLSKDYLSPTQKYSRVLVGRKREAPALFKKNGMYYLITSACTGWSPNAAMYAVSDNIFGPYTEHGNPCQGPGAATTFNAQSTFVFAIQDKPGHFIFMADRWDKRDLPKSDYLWLPLKAARGRVVIRGLD
ncbi:MAG TPA: glycoside hydrolase family 43 protein [Mucilaginibacter sp.]|nr:glycoside hydrolase family 43 protein [Mucilaginibacter sp.]